MLGEVEAPAVVLAAAVIADDAIEPALEPARQREIGAIDDQNEGVFEDPRVEPVRQDQLEADRPSAWIGGFLPFVDPGEAMAATLGYLPN